MRVKQVWLMLFAALICTYGKSQSFLTGKIYDRGYDRVVIAASVKNIHNDKLSISDMGGNYKIPASIGDKVIFSSAGYTADTITVKQSMLIDGLDIYLSQNVIQLEEIGVGGLSKYQVDSISRADEFSDALGTKTSKLVGGKGNTPTDGVGVTFSPISHFSKKEKDQRRFKRMFYKQEEEYYIDSKFPYQYVSQITGLKGDSLRTFMFKYRPSYEYCRENDKSAMLVYINDKYREFLDKPSATQENNKKSKKKKD